MRLSIESLAVPPSVRLGCAITITAGLSWLDSGSLVMDSSSTIRLAVSSADIIASKYYYLMLLFVLCVDEALPAEKSSNLREKILLVELKVCKIRTNVGENPLVCFSFPVKSHR